MVNDTAGFKVGVKLLAIFGILVGFDVGYTGANDGDEVGNDVGFAVLATLGTLVGEVDGLLLGIIVGSADPRTIGKLVKEPAGLPVSIRMICWKEGWNVCWVICSCYIWTIRWVSSTHIRMI